MKSIKNTKMAIIKKSRNNEELSRMWRNQNPHTQLVGLYKMR